MQPTPFDVQPSDYRIQPQVLSSHAVCRIAFKQSSVSVHTERNARATPERRLATSILNFLYRHSLATQSTESRSRNRAARSRTRRNAPAPQHPNGASQRSSRIHHQVLSSHAVYRIAFQKSRGSVSHYARVSLGAIRRVCAGKAAFRVAVMIYNHITNTQYFGGRSITAIIIYISRAARSRTTTRVSRSGPEGLRGEGGVPSSGNDI